MTEYLWVLDESWAPCMLSETGLSYGFMRRFRLLAVARGATDALCPMPPTATTGEFTEEQAIRLENARLRAELKGLKQRYDNLLDVKTRAAERYKADYKKWKDFKIWVFDENIKDKAAMRGMNPAQKKRYRAMAQARKEKIWDKIRPRQESIDIQVKKEPEVVDVPMEQSSGSETEEETQPPWFAPVAQSSPKHPVPPPRTSDGFGTELTNHDPRKLRKAASEEDISKRRKTTIPLNHGTPGGPLGEYMKYKGRGRYARDAKGADTTAINERFAIDKGRNQGVDFQYDAVVRNKEERKKMHAGDCECCREYYEAVGPLPARLEPPVWRSPSPNSGPSNHIPSAQAHRQQISRHRYNWERAETPPGYWNIGFPTTQEAAGINEHAMVMHRLKEQKVEIEAQKQDGRYRKR